MAYKLSKHYWNSIKTDIFRVTAVHHGDNTGFTARSLATGKGYDFDMKGFNKDVQSDMHTISLDREMAGPYDVEAFLNMINKK